MQPSLAHRLGFGVISCQLYPADERNWSDLYREALVLSSVAESLGYASVWTAEHHFVDDGYLPSLLVFSAAIAARTSRIAIGTGVLLAPLHDPIRLAEDAAVVDQLSGGRLVLGLGIGYHPIEYQGLRQDWGSRGKAMAETISLLRRAWSGEAVPEGGLFNLPPVRVRPLPYRPPPILIGGHSRRALERAARLADGFISNAAASELPAQVRLLTRELELAGRDPTAFEWLYYLRCLYPAETRRRAWREVGQYAAYSAAKFGDMEASAYRRGPPPAISQPDHLAMDGEWFIGPAEELADRVAALVRSVDVPFRFIAGSYFPGMPFNQQVEVMHRIADEVAPLIADLTEGG